MDEWSYVMKKAEKTNVMRILEKHNVPYKYHDYTDTDAIGGMDVAQALHENPEQVFKTLVTTGSSRNHYVFLVPVCRELNLKKAAKAVQEKSMEMLKAKDLLPLTGYVHGGCSPIGMKKAFKTIIDASAEGFDTIFFSGGKIGCQVELSLDALKGVLDFDLMDICD